MDGRYRNEYPASIMDQPDKPLLSQTPTSSEMSPFSQPVQDYLTQQRLGRLAVATMSGVPHISPVGYANDSENIYICTETKSNKIRIIEKNNRVAFVADDAGGPTGWRYVIVEGTAEIISGKAEFETAGRILTEKYPQFEEGEWKLDEKKHSTLVIKPVKVLTQYIP